MNEETNMQDAMAQDAAHTGMVAPVSGGTAAQRRRWTQSALVAVLSGVLALAALLLYLRRFEQEVSGGPKVRVLYALKNIPLGSAIDAAMLGERAVPSAYLSERQVPASELDRILGVRTSLGLEAGESLLWTDLATTLQQGRDLSALVPKGKRALSIRVDGASTFGQLLRPGDRVDVLLSTRETSETMTGPLLQNVMLLAVGSDTGQARNQGEVAPGAAFTMGAGQVTLSVSAEQAQVLAHARLAGSLTLALRNPHDVAVRSDVAATRAAHLLRSGDKHEAHNPQEETSR